MLLLAIDTSTTAIGAALHDGRDVIARAVTLDARAHAEHLAPNIAECLGQVGAAPSDVTGVVVGLGPGPFTGLRVGIVTARTFAFARRIPVAGVCSLDALALAWANSPTRQGDSCLVATDARRREVYAAPYAVTSGGSPRAVRRLADPVASRAAELPDDWRSLPTVGRGPGLYPDALTHDATDEVGDLLDVDPGWVAQLAVDLDLLGRREALTSQVERDDLEPLYLRRPDADPTAGQRATTERKSTLG